MGFKKLRGIRLPYRKQGRIYFALLNYADATPRERDKLDRLLASAAGGDEVYLCALREWLLRADRSALQVAIEYSVSESTLYRMRRKIYEEF